MLMVSFEKDNIFFINTLFVFPEIIARVILSNLYDII